MSFVSIFLVFLLVTHIVPILALLPTFIPLGQGWEPIFTFFTVDKSIGSSSDVNEDDSNALESTLPLIQPSLKSTFDIEFDGTDEPIVV